MALKLTILFNTQNTPKTFYLAENTHAKMELGDLLKSVEFEGIRVGSYYPEADVAVLRRISSEGVMRKGFRMRGLDFGDEVVAAARYSAPIEKEAEISAGKKGDIEKLEHILSLAYNSDVRITKVGTANFSRKEVKEVYFYINGGISKVWVFRANPEETAKELAIYHIVYGQGIPTAKPVGFTPSPGNNSYPYDIAILGGILEHAGDSYDAFLENLQLAPELMFRTAKSIGKLIADYHVKLTKAASMFNEYGITIGRASPRKELRERFLKALDIPEENAEALIAACEALYESQSAPLFISHGDLHTRQIVTLNSFDILGAQKTSIENFGVIDWGSITLDNAYGDLMDFWIHHKRKAEGICRGYDFGFGEFEQAYLEQFRKSSGDELSTAKIIPDNPLIQSSLWNLYEMFDPARKSRHDIEEKAKYHCRALVDGLMELEKTNLGKYAAVIKAELSLLLADKAYLTGILQN